ncbi:hypothetical protein Q6247_25325, partial [Klebsiella pneumoniae]
SRPHSTSLQAVASVPPSHTPSPSEKERREREGIRREREREVEGMRRQEGGEKRKWREREEK